MTQVVHLFTADAILCSRRRRPYDVTSRLFDVLPDDTWFYPGHGDDSTLGEQKPHIDEWRSRGW